MLLTILLVIVLVPLLTSAGLLAVAIICASEYDGPEEPWLEWDGDVPAELAPPARPADGRWDPGAYPGADVVRRQAVP